ncbi:MAG: hypothetical protein ABJA34_13380 [Pseudonocardiales bacterium]
MPVALGADWLPSGSTSLLAEMKVARRELARQDTNLSAADLVHTVDLVLIGGDITYVRHDWYTELVGPTIPAGTTVEKAHRLGQIDGPRHRIPIPNQ